MEFGLRVAYTFLSEDVPTANPAPYIRSAIFSIANNVYYRMCPSSIGAMMLVFDTYIERDVVVDSCPILHDGGQLTLERSEEMQNRFMATPRWLVAITAIGFPAEHWNLVGIPAGFRKLGTVVEIDRDCLMGDHSSLCVVIERVRATGVPDDLLIGNRGGLSTRFSIEVLRTWPKAEQLDALGRLCPFFPSNGGRGRDFGLGGNGDFEGADPPMFFGPPPPPRPPA